MALTTKPGPSSPKPLSLLEDVTEKLEEKIIATGFSYPHGIVRANDGSFYVADQNNNQIKQLILLPDGTAAVRYFAGGSRGYVNGVRTKALFDFVGSLAFDDQQNMYVCDTDNDCVRKIDNEGVVSTYMQNFVDNNNTSVKLSRCRSMAADRKKRFLFLTDSTTKMYKIEITTAKCIDSCIIEDFITLPRGIALDDNDNIYYTTSSRVYKLDSSLSNKELLFEVKYPRSLAVDANCRFLYIGTNHIVGRYNLHTKQLQSIVKAQWACGMAFDTAGNLFVCHYTGGCVKRITLVYSLPWKEQRVLWIGYLKNPSSGCPIARLPKDIVKEVIQFCRNVY